MSTGQELYELPDEVAKLTYEGFDGQGQRKMFCDAHLDSIKRVLAKECPDYME